MRTKNPRFNQFCSYSVWCPRGSPHTSGFLILNIQHVEYLRFMIGAPPTFFRADSVTLNTPHTTGKSDKIIFRTTKIIGIQDITDYLVVCTQHNMSDGSANECL